jgi:hypothetical protein
MSGGLSMRSFHKFVLGLILLAPRVCVGQTKCPWIQEATARGILGGPVTATVTAKDSGDGACEFARQEGGVQRHLSVLVITMTDIPKQYSTYVAQCESKSTPLKAIGNEAIECSIQTHTNLYAAKVVGRVRERAFVITVASSLEDDPSMNQEMRREKVHLAAEQVAGILF